MPRVSVIIPTHNRPELLQEALGSVLRQTVGDWEGIVVDDASADPVAFNDVDRRVRVLRHTSLQGGAAAKNTGIAAARGELLAFLDDDDLWAPQYLERALHVLDRYPDLDLVFMGVTWFGASSAWGQRSYNEAMSRTLADAHGTADEVGVVKFGNRLFDALLKSVPMAFQRPVVKKEALRRIGTYEPACLLWDCDWAIRAALTCNAALITEGLYLQRAQGQGYSSKPLRRLEHLASGIEMMDRYLENAEAGRYVQSTVPKFRDAAARAWFDLAWYHYQQGNRAKALNAFLFSQRRRSSLSRMKFLGRLMIPNLTPKE